ncbi:MAG: chromosome segregation protein SMC, partial [Veillonella sp.]|nr:chromosome segregation protein SMC [Veillonella sp.]
QLQAVIAEMDKAMSTQLYDVLDVVGRRFQEVFSQLFGGGTAQIVLTDPDNILTGGIDFYIQPPGKKRQQLTLLSGGERALTVIALLFSFLDYRPAPFCVLDEVDAALDEANVERFSSYLNRINKETQFIVVSHRKKTMEAAEVLQGVTMVERGVSRLLTVAFEDVKEDLA